MADDRGQGVCPDKLTVRLERDGEWWTSQIVEVPAAISQGDSATEAAINVMDALFTVLADDLVGGV